ncbi:MAG TPA: cyanophycinase [Thermoanaerobaculia bacterium]|nr:cyanophycinase [Thermoanaerobaculia bacterium]
MSTKKKKITVEERGNVGRMLVIGGAEDPDEDDMTILPYFVKMCGGKKARIVVCGTPSNKPLEKERKYGKLFQKIGVAKVMEAHIEERVDGERKELLEMIHSATGIFYTGGDQLRLTSTVAGTKFGDMVRERLYGNSLIVGGTSAGAAAMASTMLIGGNQGGTVRREAIQLAAGLGYWRDATVDTHFATRGRVNRLCVVFGENPQVLAIGIDENTAVDVRPGESFEVIGEGAVFVFDGKVTHSNAAEADDKEVMAITDVLMHVLPSGYRFDLRLKRPMKPDGTVIEKRT